MYKASNNIEQLKSAPDYIKLRTLSGTLNGNLLAAFVNDENPEVRETVAFNTNTPINAAITLTKDPNHHVRMSLARTTLYPEVMSILAEDRDIRVAEKLFRNFSLTPEALDLLANYESKDIKKSVASHSKTYPDTLHKLSLEKDLSILEGVSSNTNTREDTLKDLYSRNQDNRGIVFKIASNIKAPTNILTNIHKNYPKEITISLSLAKNPNTSSEVLSSLFYLYTGKSTRIIDLITHHKNTTDKTLDLIINSGVEWDTILIAIDNKNISPQTLEQLSYSDNYQILKRISEKKGLSPSTFLNLLKTKSIDVYKGLAFNPETPTSILAELTKSNNTELLEILARRPDISDKAIAKYKKLLLKKTLNKIDKAKKIPNMDYKYNSQRDLPRKVNTDLELLQRLKGYLSEPQAKRASISKEATASNLLKALAKEGIRIHEPFYHSTSFDKGTKILNQGFRAKAGGPGNDAYYDNAVCFTRNFSYTQKGVFGRAEIIFILDKAELKQRYKVYPYNWFYTVKMSKNLPEGEKKLFDAWIRGTQKEKLLSLYKELMGFDNDDELYSDTIKNNFEYLLKKFRDLGNKEKNSDFWEFEERVSTSNPLTEGVKETVIPPKYIKAVLIYDMRAVDEIRSISNIPILFYNAQKSGYYPIHEKSDLKRIPDEDLDEREIYARYKNKFNSLNTIDYKRMIRLGIRPEDILGSLKDSNISAEQLEKADAYKYLKSMVDIFDRLSTESATKEDIQMALSSVNNPFEIIRAILKSGQTQFLLDTNVMSKVKNLTQDELKIISSDAIMSGRRFKTEQKIILSFLSNIKDIIPLNALDGIVYGVLKYYSNKEIIKEFIGNKTNLNLGHVLYFIKKSILSKDNQYEIYYKKLYDFLYSRADQESREIVDSL